MSRATWFLMALLGCSAASTTTVEPSDAATCTRADPTCPSVVPSYANEVRATFEQACLPCHYPGSPYAESSLATYDAVHAVTASVLGQVSACKMPPPGNAPLTDEERDALLAWLACGAPDN